MYVGRLEIENIRSFEHVDIQFSKSINIIAGGNNAGKSTILKSIYLLQDVHVFKEEDLRIGSDLNSVRISVSDITNIDALLFQDYDKGANFLPQLPYAEV